MRDTIQKIGKAWRQEQGQSLIEMALVATLLLSIVAGVVDLGGAFHHYIVITNAAREGARQGARLPCKADNRSLLKNAITQSAVNEATNSNVPLTAANVTIIPDPVSTGCATAGGPIEVAVSFDYAPMLGAFLGFGTFTITNSVEMVYFGDDQAD